MTRRTPTRSLLILLLAGAAGSAQAATESPLAAFAMQPGADPMVVAPTAKSSPQPGFATAPVIAPTPAPAPVVARMVRSTATSLSPGERDAYRAAFAAIRAGDWATATLRLDALPTGLLTPVARAELVLAKGSPKAEATTLAALLAVAPELPQAAQLARLAAARGAIDLSALPPEHDLVRLAGPPRRRTAVATQSDSAAATLAAAAAPLLKTDQPAAAEALLGAAADISADARTEWQQRIAWAYFLIGDDAAARRMAALAEAGMGEWASQGDWVQGLAAWRQRDYAAAEAAFARTAARARDTEMTAAGLFWAARAGMASGHPEQVAARLRAASRLSETFYGMIAAGELGDAAPPAQPPLDLASADAPLLAGRQNLRVAIALSEIGERSLAESVLKHEARIGNPAAHGALIRLAAHLQLPAAQIWLAQNGPVGARLTTAMRYPAPSWTPQGGWRVDRSLVFAHTLQESQFRTDAVSGAGARGLMQVRLGTAQDIARKRGSIVDAAMLAQPAANLEYGQSYLEQLRDMPGIDGRLPKVIAAYNAGPTPVARWTTGGRDRGDPLMFIESIPYRETRGYVVTVLRNYWMYQREAGAQSASLKAIAQAQWPRFPGVGVVRTARADPPADAAGGAAIGSSVQTASTR